jgi:hypothetical protein
MFKFKRTCLILQIIISICLFGILTSLKLLHDIVTHMPIAKQRLGKQARKKYATNNRGRPLPGN